MITKEQYLTALETVEQYHKQLSLQIVMHCDVKTDRMQVFNLQIGDYVVRDRNTSVNKQFKVGKKYSIIDSNSNGLQIRNDNGLSYWIKKYTRNSKGLWKC